MNRLAVKIKESRIKAGLTEKGLAKKCGLSVNYIIQVESGKKIVNESVADKILKALGTKEELIQEEKPAEKKEKSKSTFKPQGTIPVEPNQTWADALAGVIKKYPVYDLYTNKIVAYKDLPILSKKIEGHHPDKIMFVKSSNDHMKKFRIEKGDVLTVLMTKDIQNQCIYLFEMKGNKMIRQLRKKDNKKVELSKCTNDNSTMTVGMNEIKILGKIIKNEFSI
ncbi:MAG: helix-turn-helix transcriptional regulator [Anaeromicrobium sp.]|jgi:transcriptional regulator with XRE-family HTH domain|uniref:helix-turn-helix domain-containing protein n=1 Tax=Anaeromicrobium sp. TaxID=1929132 RepID=UPI0025D0656A|nr:helix-turn-helix transcriptional regulator [Anaeromicrobium sp.]MCT4592974.1 helix-turn-helix transcriptional regulator [Anaeromicrobium sp.]